LNGTWQRPHLDVLTCAIASADRFTAPEAPHVCNHGSGDLAPILISLRREDEVVREPAGREGDPDAPAGKIVDDSPFLGNPHRVVKRQDHASSSDLHAARRCRDRRCQDGRIRI